MPSSTIIDGDGDSGVTPGRLVGTILWTMDLSLMTRGGIATKHRGVGAKAKTQAVRSNNSGQNGNGSAQQPCLFNLSVGLCPELATK
jgi:hypothetical protein